MSGVAIEYLKLSISLQFESPATADNNPLFVLRGILGYALRSICCITRQNECASCRFNRTCAYAFLFETILDKEASPLPGTDRASHPYILTQLEHFRRGTSRSEYAFGLTLFGTAIEYLPYIYAAFERAGKHGVFKTRAPFKVVSIKAQGGDAGAGVDLLVGDELLRTQGFVKRWQFPSSIYAEERSGQVLIELKSPLRFKVRGRYTADFDAADFMACLYRRARTMCALYGSLGSGDEAQGEEAALLLQGRQLQEKLSSINIAEKALKWREARHWSARQKASMELGGLVGTLKLEGRFSPLDQAVLEFGRIAGAGKNTIFGLGQMDFWTKWES